MAEKIQKTINTRIVLRNDELAKWNASTKPLLKGEAALAQLSGDLSNYFQLRIGVDGEKTWKDLEPSNILIPVNNVDGLEYSKYELRKVSEDGVYPIKYQLFGLKNKVLGGDEEWVTVSDTAIEIPEVDFEPVYTKIATLCADLSSEIEALCVDLSGEIEALSTSLSTSVGKLVSDTKTDILAEVADVSAATYNAAVSAAAADATSKATTAESNAKFYTNAVSSALSTDYQGKIDDILNKIKDGIHFVGKVFDLGIEDGKGFYQKTDGGQKIPAANGDLVIKAGIEYVYSEIDAEWVQLGDEGSWATKSYVDQAKDDAIAATKNTVQTVSAYSALVDGVNTGDVGLVKTEIGSTGKYEISAYTWDSAAGWVPMDAYYSAEKVIMPENMVITEKFGKYDIPSTGSKELTCAGMTVKAFINDAFAQTRSGTKTLPAFSLTVSGGTGEIGTNYTVPAATLKMTGVGSYQYGPVTGITVPVNRAVIRATKSGYEQELSNSTAMALNSTISTTAGTANAETYLSGGASYTYTAAANYTEGAVPKNNIGADDPGNKIPAGSFSDSKSATFTGYYPAYYAFTTSPKANPTALTANNGNVTVDGVTYTRELNSFGRTTFTASSKWYELFYLVPQAKRTSSGWKGKDSNNVDLAVEAKTTATVTFRDGTTATYNVYVVRNAAQYSATTCTMTFI